MFHNCPLLSSIPNISKWEIKGVEDITEMFYNCSSLSSLPDISKWIIKDISQLNNIFEGCLSLPSLPDIFKRNKGIKNKDIYGDKNICISLLNE